MQQSSFCLLWYFQKHFQYYSKVRNLSIYKWHWHLLKIVQILVEVSLCIYATNKKYLNKLYTSFDLRARCRTKILCYSVIVIILKRLLLGNLDNYESFVSKGIICWFLKPNFKAFGIVFWILNWKIIFGNYCLLN